MGGARWNPHGWVYCLHCGRRLTALLWDPAQPDSCLRLYASGCFCRLDTRTLRGLAEEDASALRAYRIFRATWLVHCGLDPTRARRITQCLDYPLPMNWRLDIRCLLAWRQETGDAGSRSDRQTAKETAL
jgi:hypothetical protein